MIRSPLSTLLLGSVAFAFTALPPIGSAQAAEPGHFLFVGDLKTGTLLRYDADAGVGFGTPYGLGGNLTNPAYITGQGVTEGVHGTGNTLITSQHIGSTWSIGRFDRFTGAYINKVTPLNFGGIGNILLTNDAQTLYVPDEAGNRLYRINVATGATLSSVAMTGVHDVAMGADGFVYATGYNSGLGVRRYSADLSSFTEIIANGANGLTRPTGMTFGSDGFLYIVQNTRNSSGSYPDGSVQRYTLNGSSAATFRGSVSSTFLKFGIGIDLGPDGNLYVAAPGNYSNFGGTNDIAKINLSSGFSSASPVTQFINYAGTTDTTTYSSTATNIIWPKYLKFDVNFTVPNDPGYIIVAAPEPVSAGLLGLALASVLTVRTRRRRTNRAA